ncbi:MAG: DUF4421 domain-containing protein [Oligoflexia bacterium]|nr:DUF4421 domain-containing protein [Oligoflexia bacterium]
MKLSKLILIFIFVISSVSADWTLTTAIKKPNHSLLLKEKSSVATYTPNSSFHLSLRLLGPFFFFQYSFKIPNSNFGKSDVGNDGYKDARLGIYLGNSLIEGFYKRYEGFSSTENGGKPGCGDCLIRNNLISEENLFQFIYPFNKSFSLKSAVSGANKKVTTDWSWALHFFYNRLKVKDSEGLVQGQFLSNHPDFIDLNEIRMEQFGFGPGIGGEVDLGPYFYIAGITTVGVGLQNIDLNYGNRVRELQEYGLNYNLRFVLGTHNPRYNIGIRSLIVSNFYDIGEEISFSSVNYEVRLYTSITF